MQSVCHNNLDNQYIDGIKMVYIQVDSVTRVDAVCDYKSKKGNSGTIKCAGAAEITFQVLFLLNNNNNMLFIMLNVFYRFEKPS